MYFSIMKNYNNWNLEKGKIEMNQPDTLSFHEREIWWCSIGLNIGDEQDGKNNLFERPVLIFKKFNNKLAYVFPLSSRIKDGKYYFALKTSTFECNLMLSQMRLISSKRLRRFLRKISPNQYLQVKNAFIDMLNA